MVRLRAPPPQTIQLRGRRGSSGTIRAIAAAVKAVSVAAPSAGGTSPSFSAAKSLRSSDFGGGTAKNGSSRARAIQASSALPSAANLPSRIEGLVHGAVHEIVEQRVARPGVAGDQRLVAVDIGDVGDAADIDDDDRPFALQRLRRAPGDRPARTARPARRPRRRRRGNRASRGYGSPWPAPAPSPICTVSRCSGRCSTVWPWKPTMSMSSGFIRFWAMKAATASACASVTARSASARTPGPGVASRQVHGLAQRLAQQIALAPGYRPGSRTARTPSPAFRRFRSARRPPRPARCRSSNRAPSTSWISVLKRPPPACRSCARGTHLIMPQRKVAGGNRVPTGDP